MVVENEIENSKIDLALKPDFNCEDAFRIFELNGRGYLTPEDIRYGLNLLGIYATDTDINLIMKKYDIYKEGILSYQTFFDMVVPFEKQYRNLVENRIPNSCCSCRCPEIFSCPTILCLKNLFNLIIEKENKLNCMRRGYNTLRLKLYDIYKLIDIVPIGYFTEDDLQKFLKLNGIFTTEKPCDLLFIRLDNNRNGKIELNELTDEMRSLY
jgi:Ca2+-binding EF-hand superfamily protein